MRNRFQTRFDEAGDPMSSMGNLVDVMLVFICGLIAALTVNSGFVESRWMPRVEQVRQGRELPSLPDIVSGGGVGMESVGTVYRDPKSGKLILVGQ
jgi:hypothetical protein